MNMRTQATEKLLKLNKKIRAISGGTGASKTYSILMILCDYAGSLKNQVIDVVSESYPHLEKGAIRDFKEILLKNGYWVDADWNETKHVYSFPTGSTISFVSVDNIGKAHGPRRDVLFINECNYLPFNIVDQLITRTRKIVWLDWNPVSEFWFYTDILPKRDVDFVKLTYLDNEGLSLGERAEIEAHRENKNWWKVYGLGELGEIENRIYTGWNIIDEIPYEARLERYGLDFGYTNDPTAIVALYYFNGGYILDEILYQKGMSNKDIADILKNLPKALVVADSAEPKSIDELRLYGLNVVPTDKGRDSVNWGIQMVQDQRISATKRSVNLLKEYRNYLWQTDRSGKTLGTPADIWNHCMDALRYSICSLIPIIKKQEMRRNLYAFPPKPHTNPV